MTGGTRILGVVVAGGRGMRLGLGRPKAFAEVGGMTLLARAEELLSTVCGEVVIAAPADLPLPPHRSPRVADPAGGRGPIAGVVAGLSARPFEYAIVLGVDFPLMQASVLEALLSRLGDRAAVIPSPGGVPQPLAAAYARHATAPLAEALARGERITDAALALDHVLIEEAELSEIEGGSDCFFNLNTSEDLAEAERQLSARGGRSTR